ncbi:MAG: nitroreductase [Gammaproteobacteria bacterium]|nr:MAG: nitroreductase [Gammaproteobacteria bacterium]
MNDAIKALLTTRRSVRAFLPKPVAREVLEQVLTLAACTPSNCNTQPWLIHVVSGEPLEALRKELPKRFAQNDLSLDYPYSGVYEGVYKQRQYASAQALYAAQGIERGDKDARRASFMRNFEFFGAPHVAFIFMPAAFGIREAADVGMYIQTLLLAMHGAGLGACPQTSLGFLSDPVREQLDIDTDEKLLIGISFGYPDPHAPVNRCQTERAAMAENVRFYG